MVHALQLALGFSSVVLVYLLARRLGVGNFGAFAVAAAFAVSPPLVLYEAWPLYAVATTFLVLGTTHAATRHVQEGRISDAVLTGLLLGALLLTAPPTTSCSFR